MIYFQFNIRLFVFIIITIICTLQSAAQIIDKIEFEGTIKTSESYLKSLMTSQNGDLFSDSTWTQDLQFIRNTNLFFDVSYSKRTDNDSLVLIVHCKESKYLIPIFDLSAIQGNLKVQIGGNNINWLGKGYTLGGFYQYYQRHSAKIYNVCPRHLNGKTGHELIIGSNSTIEPLYFEEGKRNFKYDNYALSIGGYYWITNFHRISLGGMLMKEDYENIDEDIGSFPLGYALSLKKYQIRTFFEYKRVNLSHQLFEGFYCKLYTEYIKTKDYQEATFLKFIANVKYFLKIGSAGNLASNIVFGVATNNNSPFSPFVLDSYTNVRGIGNRVARGTAQGIINLEYRHTIWTTNLFFLQSNIYADYGALRTPGQKLTTMFESENSYLYTGLGLRLQTRKVFNVVFRFDYGRSVKQSKSNGFVFGINQFF